MEAMHMQGIPAAVIGKIKEGNIIGISSGVGQELLPQERDEIYKVLARHEGK